MFVYCVFNHLCFPVTLQSTLILTGICPAGQSRHYCQDHVFFIFLVRSIPPSAFNTTQCVQYHPVCTRMQADPSTTFWIIGLSDRQTTVRVSEQEHPRVPLHTVHLRFLTQLWVLSPTEILRCLCRCRVSLVERKRSAEDWWTALFHGVEKNHGCGL